MIFYLHDIMVCAKPKAYTTVAGNQARMYPRHHGYSTVTMATVTMATPPVCDTRKDDLRAQGDLIEVTLICVCHTIGPTDWVRFLRTVVNGTTSTHAVVLNSDGSTPGI